MNFIDFTKTGGYRFKQFTLRKMQEAYFSQLKAFVEFCNVAEVGSFVISGMKPNNGTISAGYAYIDGELCRFEASPGTELTRIRKNVVIQSLGFQNGNNENVFRFVNAETHPTEGIRLGEFTRLAPVFDSQYVRTDNNFTNALLNKLNALEPQVQADWNVVNPGSLAFIRNKPAILNVLKQGRVILGDIGNQNYPIVFDTPVANANYDVYVSFESSASLASNSATYFYVTHSKTESGFTLTMRETGNITQFLIVNYLIINQN